MSAHNPDNDNDPHLPAEQPPSQEEPTEWEPELPPDLPRTLDDRRNTSAYTFQAETEYYDAWQGQAQTITAPSYRPSSSFLSPQDAKDDARAAQELADNEARIAQMLTHQTAAHADDDADQESQAEAAELAVMSDIDLDHTQKSTMLHDFLSMAASNGDLARVQRLLSGKAAKYVNVNRPDAEGTPPLVYASCFGHKAVVVALLDAGAIVDNQDRNQWTPLVWAMTNRHKDIAKVLLDHGASVDIQSSSGRTPRDFVPPDSELSGYLSDAGYSMGAATAANTAAAGRAGDDFYSAGMDQDRFEDELADNEMKRRMMMESARNLEVDLGSLGIDERPDTPTDEQDEDSLGHGQGGFIWDKCLNDQMFVFQEKDIDRTLNIIVTDMTPQRSSSQKPIPANTIFLGARYAHYHANAELLTKWLTAAQTKINAVVEARQGDMTILAFWVSNATLLLYYLKKDYSLSQVTVDFQAQVTEQIHRMVILVVKDAEKRINKYLDAAMLDYETIPGFEDVQFQNEWNFLRRKPKIELPESLEKRIRPQSPTKRARTSPTNIISLLSSTLFVLDLYDVHSVITSQALSQLFYWLGAEIFNRIMSNKRFLARTKAMQIRMNISTLEDWARNNNRQPEHYEDGSMVSSGENTVEAARKHLAPVVQLLQWLQCFSSLGTEDEELVTETLQQLPRMSSKQLLFAVKSYRAEVGEKVLNKATLRLIQDKKSMQLQVAAVEARQRAQSAGSNGAAGSISTTTTVTTSGQEPDAVMLDSDLLLPFSLPTSTDMLVTFGAGFGGVNKERARRYIPSIPPDFLAKLDPEAGPGGDLGGKQRLYEHAELGDDEDEGRE